MGTRVGIAAGKHGIGSTPQAGPAWAGLHFGPRPSAPAGPGRGRHWPLALASLAAHGLLIAALLQAAPSQPLAGNSESAPERVQLRFVTASSILREQGAAAASPASLSPPQAPASTSTSTASTTATARPLPVSPVPAPLAVASLPAATGPASAPPAGPAVQSVAATAAAPATAADATAASHGTAGPGLAAHGHGSASHSSAPAQDSQGVADWSQAVMRQLARFRTYPAAARAQRVEGVVMVHATIAADGQVLATRVRHSCGNPDLDAEALATFSRARRLPAPPAHLPSPLQVDLPVAFTLRS
ncbi:energy transducer TonB family protein [Stenotrophomonas ginsengisoli]|uniref:energy transducer TonB family protein n=1 Tax=Stenotrophomonas ginsengisoli TaxID=336566 RepID=UPI00070BC5A0|nr:energy transducer TonB [Stenotrophomonas ginsengisoli]